MIYGASPNAALPLGGSKGLDVTPPSATVAPASDRAFAVAPSPGREFSVSPAASGRALEVQPNVVIESKQ